MASTSPNRKSSQSEPKRRVARKSLSRPKRKAASVTKRRVITEDEADAIISLRRLRTEKAIPLEEFLKRYGYGVEG